MAAYPLVSFLTANFAQGNRNLLRTVYRASTLAALVTLSSTVVYAQDKSALTSLNEKAREFYAQARERAINESKPLILCYSDRIVLITNDKREEFKDIPDNYHVLKTVDHIALGLYSLLNHQEGKAVSESDKKTLIDFKPIIAKARAALTECGLSQPVVERQYRMIDNSIAFIDESLIPDELFLQTLVLNSSFSERLYWNKFDDDYRACMRAVEWRPRIYTYKSDDFQRLVDSECLFARKFDVNADSIIIDLIVEHLKHSD